MVVSTTFLEERRGGQSGSLQVACDRMVCIAVIMMPSSPWRQDGGRDTRNVDIAKETPGGVQRVSTRDCL